MRLLLLVLFIINTGFESSEAQCQRIISLAPSLTEVLYKLELGDKIIAVSDYDAFPEEVKNKKRVGGFLNLNLEGIVSLEPDIVIGLKEHSVFADKYKQTNRQILLVNHNTVSGILNSFKEIADYCSISDKGDKIKASLTEEVKRFKSSEIKERPSVLLTVGRSADTPSSRSFFISGKDGFYDELINYAGGINVISEKTIFSGNLSAESLIALNPDIIIEISGKDSAKNIEEKDIKESWSKFTSIKAVKNNNIYIIKKDYADIPGPRFIYLLDDFSEIFRNFHK